MVHMRLQNVNVAIISHVQLSHGVNPKRLTAWNATQNYYSRGLPLAGSRDSDFSRFMSGFESQSELEDPYFHEISFISGRIISDRFVSRSKHTEGRRPQRPESIARELEIGSRRNRWSENDRQAAKGGEAGFRRRSLHGPPRERSNRHGHRQTRTDQKP
jgi:hypothetical protein